MHLAGFAPAFTLSHSDKECSRKPPNAHSLSRYQQAKKKKEDEFATNKFYSFRQEILENNRQKTTFVKHKSQHMTLTEKHE